MRYEVIEYFLSCSLPRFVPGRIGLSKSVEVVNYHNDEFILLVTGLKVQVINTHQFQGCA